MHIYWSSAFTAIGGKTLLHMLCGEKCMRVVNIGLV